MTQNVVFCRCKVYFERVRVRADSSSAAAAALGREATGMPFKVFVMPKDIETATKLITEDKSLMMDDPNLDFTETT